MRLKRVNNAFFFAGNYFDMKLSNVLQGFWLDRKTSFSTRTVENYIRFFRYFQDFLGDVEFDTITSDDIRHFLRVTGI
jgi:hypothetical protein